MMIWKTEIWEFYTTTKDGAETIVATKTLKYPKRSIHWKRLMKQGFANGVHSYGFRIQATYKQ